MDFNATIDLIIKDLDEARKIIDDLKKYPGVPVLQVELAKAKCKSAGEVIALLKEVNIIGTVNPEVKTEFKAEVKAEVRPEEKQEVKADVKPQVIAENKTEPETAAEPVVKQQLKKEIITEPAVVPKSVKPIIQPDVKTETVVPKVTEEQAILGDSFSHLSNRFNEQLGNLVGDDISGKINSQPITNLAEAIGLNDKFLFMKDIFNGDKEAYSQAISRLEASPSIADARAVIMSYTGNNTENEAVKQLIDLVKRKLPSNE